VGEGVAVGVGVAVAVGLGVFVGVGGMAVGDGNAVDCVQLQAGRKAMPKMNRQVPMNKAPFSVIPSSLLRIVIIISLTHAGMEI
jgi:hypothetical protein